MAYDPEQLFLITSAGGDKCGQTWRYEGTDDLATVAGAGFIDDADDRGMRIGDAIEVIQFTTTAKAAVTATGKFIATAVSTSGATLQANKVATATATAGAATANGLIFQITSEGLTTAAAAEYTLTLTNDQIAAGDIVIASVDPNGSAGTPGIGGCETDDGSVVITVTNLHASAAFDAAIVINGIVIKV